MVSNLGKRTRYYSPAISGDGTQELLCEQTENQQFNLVILNMDGTLKQKIPSPGNRFLQHPAWMENDTALVVLLSGIRENPSTAYSCSQGQWTQTV